MQVLPRDFLIELGCKQELSPEQQEAFIERFSSNKSELSVADALHISPNAFRTRMSGVYYKFSIRGKGPGKFHRLRDFLAKEYQKSNSSPIPDVLKVDLNIDALVQEVREKVKPSIQERCGTMRVLDMSQLIGLNDIYTNVNILEKITGRRHKKVDELLQECNSEDFERFGLGKISEERVPGLDAVEKYPKLMILGKPGAGKTTFLKYVAIQCNGGEFQAECVPIFVTLKDFAEAANKPSLLEYISHQFFICRVTATQFTDLCNQSRALVLLDGLDEVREEDSHRVLNEIRDFSQDFHNNHFVITCRIAAQEYTFEKFTEVEVANFDDEQIATFSNNWFKDKAVKAESFLERLEDNERINEIATSPLLLTLLCLTFEESGDFPANRSELYKEGLDALLKKWDAKRAIYRAQVYQKLSVQRKEKLLSKIALTTFERLDYFFKQKAAEQYITDYIRNLPDAKTDPEELQLDSERVLKSIESQHGLLVERAKGIYSFSHLTFHEYFTAREIVYGIQPLEKALSNLVSHITEKRWREVFLLAVGMLQSADCLLQLMKKRVDALIALDDELQHFLIWVRQKQVSLEVSYKSATVRALYFTHGLNIVFHSLLAKFNHTDLASKIDSVLKKDLEEFNDCEYFTNPDLHTDGFLSEILTRALRLCKGTPHEFDAVTIRHEISMAFCEATDEIVQLLEELENQLRVPEIDENNWDLEKENKWWKVNGSAWADTLRAGMIKHRNIGYDWQFSKQQKELLEQYYYANKLLVECLNSDCYVSREVRSQIEDTLLLPIAEIERRKGEFV